MEQPCVEPVRQAKRSAFSYASTHPYSDSAREALDLSTISFDNPSGHKPGHVVQSIHSLLRSDSRDLGGSGRSTSLKQRPRSCELPRGPCSGCPMLPMASRHKSLPNSLPPPEGFSRQNSGCIPSPSRQRSGSQTPPKAAAPGCPIIPGLTWKKLLGSGSFARVYRGEWHSMPVAIKMLSSKANEGNMSGDLFESLLSANMHHPNVVETYEVLTVEPPAHENCPMNSGKSGSLHEVLSRVGSAPSPADAAAQASKLDSIASFFANQRDQQEVAGSTPLEGDGSSAFAPAARCAEPEVDIEELAGDGGCPAAEAGVENQGLPGQPSLSLESLSPKVLRGILDRAGSFLATRVSSLPLPLSPFDNAISRAFTAGSQDLDAGEGLAAKPGSKSRTASTSQIGFRAAVSDTAAIAAIKCGSLEGTDTNGDQRISFDVSSGGCGKESCCGGPSASALIGIARHAANAAASPPAEGGFRGCCGSGERMKMDSSGPLSCSDSCACCGEGSSAVPCTCAPIRAAARPPSGRAPGLRRSFEGPFSGSVTSQYNMQSLASGDTTRTSSMLSVKTATGGSMISNSGTELIGSWMNCSMGSEGIVTVQGSRTGSLASLLPNRVVAPVAELPPPSPPRPLPPLPAPASRGGTLGGDNPVRDPLISVEPPPLLHSSASVPSGAGIDVVHPGAARYGAPRQHQRLPPTLPQPVRAEQSRAGSDAGRTAGGTTHTGGSPIPAPPPPPPPRQPQVLLLMELGDQKSLHTAISKGRLAGNLEAILLCALDIAAGMEYLHSMGIIHADLKPANVLLMSAPATTLDPRGFTCKIADFGMSQVLTGDSSYVPVADTHGSLPYVAPEVLQDGEVAKRADVYSFAMVLLEMWSGKVAYSDDNYHSVLFSVFSGRRPNVPDDIPPEYCTLIKECWTTEPKRRPTFAAAHARLSAQLATLRGHLTPKQAVRLASLGNRRVHCSV